MNTFSGWFAKAIIFLSAVFPLLAPYFFEKIFPIYFLAYRTQLIIAAIFLFLIILIIDFYIWQWRRTKAFIKNFKNYKPISKLAPLDFNIVTYHESYIPRKNDNLKIARLLKDNNIAFITGIPGTGKTREAYEIIGKYPDWFLLMPEHMKLNFKELGYPLFFSRKKIILVLDDLEKFIGKINLDEFILTLKKKCRRLKIIVTCRTGDEFKQTLGYKEMEALRSKCLKNEVEPRKLDEAEQKLLAEKIGIDLTKIQTDGTPGSIVLNLSGMKKRYSDLKSQPKSILHILKLLRQAMIFNWPEKLIRDVAAIQHFELTGQGHEWNEWFSVLCEQGFISKVSDNINIVHDTYLDDNFIDDFMISDNMLISLKQMLCSLKDSDNLFDLGTSFYHKKNHEESIDSLKKSIKIKSNALAYNNLGILFDDLERHDEAEKNFKKAIEIEPNYAYTHYNLGIFLAELERHDEAEKEYRKAIKIEPSFAKAHYNLGSILYNLERHDEAEKEYRKAIEIEPNDAKAHYNLGVLFQNLERYDEAEREYRKAIKIEPNDAKAHTNLGILFDDLERHDEAEKEYRKAIEIEPNDTKAHNNLGALLYKLDRHDETEKEYRKAIEIQPNDAKVYASLGLLYIKIDKSEKAKEAFQKALHLFSQQGRDEDARKLEDILRDLG